MPLCTVNANGNYIGTMILSAAHIVAKAMCAKMGDVVTIDDNIPDDDWYYDTNPYRVITTYTYFHNGTSVICCEEVCDENEVALDAMLTDNARRIHTSAHMGKVSMIKFMRRAQGTHWAQNRAVCKHVARRSERRVGKALTKYEIASEGY
jgi:hypothetical protein